MIKILKASAGSGKTFALANEYISLLTEKYAYRHILAVTFTNKATAEMKSRILKFLAQSPDAGKREMLRDILHDYSAFAVSTIDKFFQQALKAFAREIGQSADYQIDLDQKALIREAMDRILDSLTRDDTDILEWLQRSVSEDLERGKKIKVEDSLYEMGYLLMMPGAGSTDVLRERFSKENLSKIKKNCAEIIERFTGDLNAAAKQVVVNKAVSIKQLAPYQEGYKTWELIPKCKATLMKEADGSTFCELLSGKRYIWYRTAWMLRDMAFSLGLAGEFYRSFEQMLKERNLMVLDRSNEILKDIIAGSDAPFVYEKMGVRYENFLLDEFQDTSNIQWENFRPLLRESESNGHGNLIVGDVKQSIYRWRDSDWTLLARRVGEEFPEAESSSLQNNWRSLRTVVDFNNRFFSYAASVINHPELYADVCQQVRNRDKAEGFVRVSFCDKEEEVARVIESIYDARKAGADFSDIAVLVRKNVEGGILASALIAEGIPVVSDDSLHLKNSRILRKLTGILANHENPDDLINAYLAKAENVVFPTDYHSLTDLCEALLRELRAASPEEFDGETLYIQAFMDDLREWTDSNGNELRAYLKHWEVSNLSITSPAGTSAVRIITIHKAKGLEYPYVIFPFACKVGFFKECRKWCPLDTEGTPFIPEAAGLYPVHLDSPAADTLFAGSLEKEKDMQLVDNINTFYVALTRAEKCLHIIAASPSRTFKDSLKKTPEYKNFAQVLYSFCGAVDEVSYGKMYDFTSSAGEEAPSSALLRNPIRENASEGASSPAEGALRYVYSSIPIGDRLKASADASDFFGQDGVVGASASPRRNGIALHGILSEVQTVSDLRHAVDSAVADGTLSPAEAGDAFALLSERTAAHPEWFSSPGLNETTVFDTLGREFRPDRVIRTADGMLIIDYKFGESSPESDARYSKQVSRYMKIFRSMGYGNVCGAVWYVVEDKIISLQSE